MRKKIARNFLMPGLGTFQPIFYVSRIGVSKLLKCVEKIFVLAKARQHEENSRLEIFYSWFNVLLQT
jgi:hypothetical protein